VSEYKAGDSESRRQAVNGAAQDGGIMFSLSPAEYAKLDDAIATEPEYAEIRKFMRTTPISFAARDRGDGSDYGFDSYNDMRKQYFGKLKLVNEGGETPDGIYQELQYAFGKGFFPDDITNPMDKWRRVLDVVDEAWANKAIIDGEERRLKALRAEARNTPNSSEAFNDELVSDRLAQLADLREMGIELDRDSRTNRVMTRQGENYERRIARLKGAKAKAQEKYEKQNRRAQIRRHAKDLSAKLLRPSDAKHVPEGLRGAVTEFLSAIDLDDSIANKIGALKKRLEIDGEELVIDPDLQGYIEDAQATDVERLKYMSAAQLETLWKALRGIEAAVGSANKAFALKRTETISAVSDKLREDAAYNRKKETSDSVISAKMKQLVKLDMLTPETFFHMLGDAGNEMFRTLRDAQDKTTRIAAQVQKFTEKTLKQYKVDVPALEREKQSVTLGGEKVTMTTAQLMKLYALTRREQALEHIFAGGLLPSAIKERAKTRKRISTVRNVTQGELSEALKLLTDEQKAYVRAMQRYQSETLGAYGNEASQEVYGYKKFTEDYYSAIRSDSREIMTSIERATRQTSVKNRGMSKPVVPHASTAVRVDSFFDDFSQSAADMATYAGQLAAEADMMRILNRKFRNPDGGVYDTTKQILDEFFGGKGSDYALKLMTDLAGGIEGAHDGTGALTRMFKSGAVGANLRVVVQQPTALIRAGDMISPKYLLEGALPRKGWEKAKKYAPIAQWKDWGYFDVGTGRSLKSVLFNADSKLEKARSLAMAPAGKADALAWGLLWNAAEAEAKAKIKRGKSDLKAGTSAFYEAVAERFTEIVDHTQVVDGILQRSQIMRSGNAVTQMATAFMAEPTKKYNMFISALSDVRAAHKKGTAAGPALRHAARTMASLIVAGAANAAAQALIDALRDDDKEKKFAQKFAEALFGISDDDETFLEKLGTFISGNLFGELAGIGDIPFAKDVFSIMQGYKIKRLDMEVVEDAITASQSLLKALTGEGKMTVGNALTRTVGALAALAGHPVENVRRDVTASVNTALAAIGNWEMIYRADKLLYDISADANKKRFKDIAYFAWLEGDTEQYRAIVKDMKANGFTDEDIEKGITAGVRRSEGYISELEKTQSGIESAIAGDATYRGLPDEQKEKLAKDAETYAKAVTLEQLNRDYAIKDTAWENKARNAPKNGVTVAQT
jgi:hypothetical protein